MLVKEVPLSRGLVALVDDDDYERVMKYKWCMGSRYPMRSVWVKSEKQYKTVLLHRFILNLKQGEMCDHINRITTDARKCNLRVATNSQNQMNSPKCSGYSSRFKGVTWRKKKRKWEAGIMYNNKTIYLGYFKIEEDAARAYDKKAKELFGEYARLNNV